MPTRKKEKIDKLNQADSMIFQTEKQIKEFADKLSDTNKTDLNTALDALKEAHKSGDLDKIDSTLNQMTEVWNRVSTEMYNNSSADNTANSTTSADDTATDVEFEEMN
jgi:molecular chaperone DnaK